MKLNKYDYELLKFLRAKGHCPLEEILKKFPDNIYGTKYRLRLLSEKDISTVNRESNYSSKLSNIKFQNYIVEDSKVISRFHIISNNVFYLSSKGYKTLLDRELEKKEFTLKKIEDFIFKILPLLISLLAIYKSS